MKGTSVTVRSCVLACDFWRNKTQRIRWLRATCSVPSIDFTPSRFQVPSHRNSSADPTAAVTLATARGWIARSGLLLSPVLWGLVLVMAAGAEVAYLMNVNRGLAAQNATLRGQELASQQIRVGDEVLGVTGFDMTGRRLRVKTKGPQRSLIITISTGCPGCTASVAAFTRLAQHAQEKGLQAVFVSRDYLEDMTSSPMAALPGAVMAEPTYRTFKTVKLLTVPQAMVVSPAGLVEAVVIGAIDASREAQIRRAIDQ